MENLKPTDFTRNAKLHESEKHRHFLHAESKLLLASHETPNCTNLKSTGLEAATGHNILLPIQNFIVFFLPWANHPWANNLRKRPSNVTTECPHASMKTVKWNLVCWSCQKRTVWRWADRAWRSATNKMEWVQNRRDTCCEMKSYRIWKICWHFSICAQQVQML